MSKRSESCRPAKVHFIGNSTRRRAMSCLNESHRSIGKAHTEPPKKISINFDSNEFLVDLPKSKTVPKTKRSRILKDPCFKDWTCMSQTDPNNVKCQHCAKMFYGHRWILALHGEKEHNIQIQMFTEFAEPAKILQNLPVISKKHKSHQFEWKNLEEQTFHNNIVVQNEDMNRLTLKLSPSSAFKLWQYGRSKRLDSLEQSIDRLLYIFKPSTMETSIEKSVCDRFDRFLQKSGIPNFYEAIDKLLDVYDLERSLVFSSDQQNLTSLAPVDIEKKPPKAVIISPPSSTKLKPPNTLQNELGKSFEPPTSKLARKFENLYNNCIGRPISLQKKSCILEMPSLQPIEQAVPQEASKASVEAAQDSKMVSQNSVVGLIDKDNSTSAFKPFERITVLRQVKMETFCKKSLPFRGEPLQFPTDISHDTPATYFCRQVNQDARIELYNLQANMSLSAADLEKASLFFSLSLFGKCLDLILLLAKQDWSKLSEISNINFLKKLNRDFEEHKQYPSSFFGLIKKNMLSVPPSQYVSIIELQFPVHVDRMPVSGALETSNECFSVMILADNYGYVLNLESFGAEQQLDAENVVVRMLVQSLRALNNHKVFVEVPSCRFDTLLAAVVCSARFEALAQVSQSDERCIFNSATRLKLFRNATMPVCAQAALQIDCLLRGQAETSQCNLYVTKHDAPPALPVTVCSSYVSVLPRPGAESDAAAISELKSFRQSCHFEDVRRILNCLTSLKSATSRVRDFVFHSTLMARNSWILYNRHREYFDLPVLTFETFLAQAAEEMSNGQLLLVSI